MGERRIFGPHVVMVHADGGLCHGVALDDHGQCPACKTTPDRMSSGLWPVSHARMLVAGHLVPYREARRNGGSMPRVTRVTPQQGPVYCDERVELVIEPGQTADVAAHFRHVVLARVRELSAHAKVWVLGEKEAHGLADELWFQVLCAAISSPDVTLTMLLDRQSAKPMTIGGPWVSTKSETGWTLPVPFMVPKRFGFAIYALNPTRETIRVVIYLRTQLGQ